MSNLQIYYQFQLHLKKVAKNSRQMVNPRQQTPQGQSGTPLYNNPVGNVNMT